MKTFVLFSLCVLFILYGCKKGEQEAIPETVTEQLQQSLDLEEEIIQTPPSIVSITSTIDLDFRRSIVPGHLHGTRLDKNPFTLEPAVEGHAEWISGTLLRFIPDKPLPAGKRIAVTLHGNILLGEQKNVNDFRFFFKVAEQEVLSLEGDFMPVTETKNGVVYEGTLSFAQPVAVNELKRELTLEGPIGMVLVSLAKQDDNTKITVRTNTLIRGVKGQSFIFNLPAKYTANTKKWEKSVYLPEVNVFRILSHMDMSDPESDRATYGFRFSDPIQQNIDLSGFISITPALEYEIKIQEKYILVHADFIAGQSYQITISKGFPSAFGTKLLDDYRQEFTLNNVKPEVNWLSQGVYLPSSNTFKLQFKSVNVGRVDLAVFEIFPDNIGFFIQRNLIQDLNDQGRYGGNRYQDLDRVAERIYKKQMPITTTKNKWIKSEIDLSPVFKDKKNAVFVVTLNFGKEDLTGRVVNNRNEIAEGDLYFEQDDYYNDPSQRGYYYARGNLSKLLLSSDIGLTIKKTDTAIDVFAIDILSAQPIAGLQLQMLSYQNKLLETQTTGNDGHASFTEKGYYIFGRNASGMALLKLDHHNWQLNTFDVGGVSGGKKGTNVFIYTDRGVHRPGDAIHLSAIVRVDRMPPPEKQPILLKVKNPKGQLVLDTKTSAGFNGHVYFPIQTDLTDPTGDWQAEINVGGQKFYKKLKVETVKPNRLKINFDLPEEIDPPNLALKGVLTTKYLFGAPAAGLRSTIRIELLPKSFYAEKYPEFIFSNPLMRFDQRLAKEYDITLDKQGVFTMNYELVSAKKAPALIRANLETTVYEKGGSFTQHRSYVTVYPFNAFVGIKNIFRWGSARLGDQYALPILVVDERGRPVAGHKLKVVAYVSHRHWWYHYDRRDQRDFKQMASTYKIGEYNYRSKDDPIEHKFSVEDYGRHFIEVIDETSGHSTGIFFYAYRWGRPQLAEEEMRHYLQMSSNKNVYTIGDQAILTFDSPGQGIALFTLEQGRRIIQRQWKRVEQTTTTISFNVREEMIPNCYASVSLIQPHNQNTNDLPMRLYGIKTIFVEDEATRLPLTLSMPEELKPKEKFDIKITSLAPAKATYTIAIVDEGLLDLTAFETPSPWDHYFQKINLAVQTTDNFDEIIGVLYPDIDKYFSIGGGDAFESERKKRLDKSEIQRFIPVVLYHKPITINPGQTIKVTFTMLNYVGSIRVMVIGTSGHSYATLEKAVPVKQSLMILPTVPRVARPDDRFALPVSVFAMHDSIRTVDLSLTSSDNLEVVGKKQITTMFTKAGEQDVAFAVKVGNRVGADSLQLIAKSGKHVADYKVTLAVTSPNPFYTEVTDTFVVQGEAVTLIPQKVGLEGTNKAILAFSRFPDIQLEKRVNYLLQYPYGCIEQTISSVFPQLYLTTLLDLKPYQKQLITDNINAGIKRLNRYQMSRGFAYWPVSNYHRSRYSDWCSSYTGHFLILAKELGYNIPQDLYHHWLEDARDNAKHVDRDNHRYQTYRLFLLALGGKPQEGAMNLVRENYLPDLDPLSKKFLAAAYFLSGKKEVAGQIDRATTTEITDYREMSGTYGSSLRDRALMTYLCLKMNDQKTAARLLNSIIQAYKPYGWYSTQETAMTLLAIGTYYKEMPITGGMIPFTVKMGDKGEQKMELKGFQMTLDLENMWGNEIRIRTERQDPLFVTLFEEGIPRDDRIKTGQNGIDLKRNFFDEDGLPVTVEQRQQGKPFWVLYTVKSTYYESLKELALTSVFPSGWEIVNTRMTGAALPAWLRNKRPNQGEYMDIRDDRVNWFFDLNARREKVFAVKINPTFKGDYTLPAVVVEPMYSPEFYARIAGGKVSVK